jgi:hypothetical protein
VVGADDPDRSVGLEQPARGGQPGAGKLVVDLEARELVPLVVDSVDLGIVRTVQVALELQVVRRVCKNQIDGAFRKAVHHLDAITGQNLIERQSFCRRYHFVHHVCLVPRVVIDLVVVDKFESDGIRRQFLF